MAMHHSIPPIAILLQARLQEPFSDYFNLPRISAVAVLILTTWLAIRYLSKFLDFLSTRSRRARFVVLWIQPVIRIGLWLGALLLSFNLLAPTQETFWAGLASVGLAVGLGAQEVIRNLISGLLILSVRPFQLGDRVKVGDAYGEIDYIGLHSTKLTTPDDTRVTIPNSQMANSQIFNANSGVPDCQVVTDLLLPFTTDPRVALQIGNEAATTCPYLLTTKPVVALLSDVFDQQPYLRLRIKAYVYDHRFEPRMQSDITARAKSEFLKLGLLEPWARHPDRV
jgi:small-conductance mechanosensitive channel